MVCPPVVRDVKWKTLLKTFQVSEAVLQCIELSLNTAQKALNQRNYRVKASLSIPRITTTVSTLELSMSRYLKWCPLTQLLYMAWVCFIRSFALRLVMQKTVPHRHACVRLVALTHAEGRVYFGAELFGKAIDFFRKEIECINSFEDGDSNKLMKAKLW